MEGNWPGFDIQSECLEAIRATLTWVKLFTRKGISKMILDISEFTFKETCALTMAITETYSLQI